MQYYQLMPKLMTVRGSKSLSLSITTDPDTSNNFSVEGIIRRTWWQGAFVWKSEDVFGHTNCKYKPKYDYRDIQIEADVETEGDIHDPWVLDDFKRFRLKILAGVPSGTHGGSDHPGGRGNMSTSPVVTEEVVFNLAQFFRHDEFGKRKLEISFQDLLGGISGTVLEIHIEFDVGDYKPDYDELLNEPKWFRINFYNWKISGSSVLAKTSNSKEWDSHKVNPCIDYDGIYYSTPERIVEQLNSLGFDKTVRLDLGGKDFYETEGIAGQPIDLNYGLNHVCESWVENLLIWLKKSNYDEVIVSVALSTANTPLRLSQKYFDGEQAFDNREKPHSSMSFTNRDVISYYKKLIEEVFLLQTKHEFPMSFQISELGWNFYPSLHGPPAFYDSSTSQKYIYDHKSELPVIKRSDVKFTPNNVELEEALLWLQKELGDFSKELNRYVKNRWSDKAKLGLLFSVPMAVDDRRYGKMSRIVNLPKDQWAYSPNVYNSWNYFQIEDFIFIRELSSFDGEISADRNRVLLNREKAFSFPKDELGYPTDKTYYLAGYANSENNEVAWDYINESLVRAINDGMKSFVWSFARVLNDDWIPKPGMFKDR